VPVDADLAAVGAAIGEPARAAMLSALLGGRAIPAGELALAARVAPSTASEHLARLTAAGLVAVERHGRHRFYRLAGDEVAHALEALEGVAAPRAPRSLAAQRRTAAERRARSCYDHLAGTLGVAVADQLCEVGALDRASLGLADARPFRLLGVPVDDFDGRRRPLTRACLDWSERRPHLAGQLGAALLTALLERRWLVRTHGRALAVTAPGRDGLRDALGLDPDALVPRAR
jgi:DNA-binding transcriptional ArsR family regulator